MSGVDTGARRPQGRGRRDVANGGEARWRGHRASQATSWCRKRANEQVEVIARGGGTPLLVAQNHVVLGTIHLKDIVKPGIENGSRSCAGWVSAR